MGPRTPAISRSGTHATMADQSGLSTTERMLRTAFHQAFRPAAI